MASTTSALRVLAFMAVVLPVVLYVTVGTYRYSQIRAETDVRLDRSLRIAREHAIKVLETNETLLGRVADAVGSDDAPAIRSREKSLHDQLRGLLQNRPQINAIWVVDANGRPLASGRVYPVPPDLDISDRDYFRWHQQGQGGLFVSQPLAGRLSRENILLMSIGRYATDGRFTGMLSISLLPAYFEKLHSDLVADEPGLAITMLRDNGAIYSRWPPLPDAPASLSPGSPVMAMIKAGKTSGSTIGVSSVDGRKRILMFSKVGDYPIYLGTGMDMGDITKRWLKEMAWLAAFGLPPLLGLLYAVRVALRRSRDVLLAADRLKQETLALRRVEEALLQSQKLEALGRLTGGVAHDFNNALMVISNNLYILNARRPEKDRPQLDSMARAVDSATKLTRQLLGFSRRQALVPEFFDLETRLPLLKELLAPVLGSQIRLHIEVAPGTLAILVDPAEFELALINLAINARDAMPTGGTFTIVANNAGDDLPATLDQPMVLVRASDTGTGIAAGNLAKVFEPFFTTKPVGEGTGLGLSQVYGMCQRAGGLATITSQPGSGTHVTLYFPPTHESPPVTHLAAQVAHRQLGRKVLLVEDNVEVASALMPVLQSMGCTVRHLDRATTAQDWLSSQTELPDVLLSDVVMPGGMDGVALAQYVRANFGSIQIVLMTGYSEQLDAITRLGFEIIPKPCSAELLARALERDPAPSDP